MQFRVSEFSVDVDVFGGLDAGFGALLGGKTSLGHAAGEDFLVLEGFLRSRWVARVVAIEKRGFTSQGGTVSCDCVRDTVICGGLFSHKVICNRPTHLPCLLALASACDLTSFHGCCGVSSWHETLIGRFLAEATEAVGDCHGIYGAACGVISN